MNFLTLCCKQLNIDENIYCFYHNELQNWNFDLSTELQMTATKIIISTIVGNILGAFWTSIKFIYGIMTKEYISKIPKLLTSLNANQRPMHCHIKILKVRHANPSP